jgi:hypothetical protein
MWHKTSFPKEPAGYKAGRRGTPFISAPTAGEVPAIHSFYPSCRYWYKRAFFACQMPDVLVFSESSGADPHCPNFGISICFQPF